MIKQTAEYQRLVAHHKREANWREWGPYLSERAWGTVREDYSQTGDAWSYFPYEHSYYRTYRWNEDGLGGISDRYQYLCFALALWNGQDEMLKERSFGLNQHEGNHGEDGKEYYFYLDNMPTHSYMKMLYKYPQQAFPYLQLVTENIRRSSLEPEYELMDTGIFNQNKYFDVEIEYAKADQDDILIRISAINRGSDPALLYLLPTLWFRNTWSWGYPNGPMNDILEKPYLFESQNDSIHAIEAYHPNLHKKSYYLYNQHSNEWIFTENETNTEVLYKTPNATPYVKDAFHQYLIHKKIEAVNPEKKGTKTAAIHYKVVQPEEKFTICLRLTTARLESPFHSFDEIFEQRKKECDQFYDSFSNPHLCADKKLIQRQAFASLLWSKQLYYYDMEQWLAGDPAYPPPDRQFNRNQGWIHLTNFDVISMPDKWEYPWYASWDLAFHCIPLVMLDPDYAKRQIILMTREWYMHPNGQLPAYEWNFNDVNPPVLAWAAWRVYKIDAKQQGQPDRQFLEGIFHKLLLNFTWWVNQKDILGNNIFQGGFLGLDNISIFDRSFIPFTEGRIDQVDGTAWMGFYCIIMMKIALELSKEESVYQDSATKFFEHFLRIASAMSNLERKGYSLWCEDDGFFYDSLHVNQQVIPLRIRSVVGLLPLLSVETIEPTLLHSLPIFKSRMEWFLSQRQNYTSTMASVDEPGIGARRLMSLLPRERLVCILRYLLDENEFLSQYGIRSLSKYHQDHPYSLELNGKEFCIQYHPGETLHRDLAGGNSNWRGPIWFPINYLIIESLQKFHYYYGDTLKVEFPTGSGHFMNLEEVAHELSKRLISLFTKKENGCRPIFPEHSLFNVDPYWKDLIFFNEFFHGDSGIGLGANHQTGWTSLIAKLIQQSGED